MHKTLNHQRKDEFLTDDQVTYEEGIDTFEESDMKPVIKSFDENMQSTSSSGGLPRRALNFGMSYVRMLYPTELLARAICSGKREFTVKNVSD